jgi:hypothetical protein
MKSMSDLTKLRIPTEKAIFDDMLAEAERLGLYTADDGAAYIFCTAMAHKHREIFVKALTIGGTEPNPDDISADGRTQGVRAI